MTEAELIGAIAAELATQAGRGESWDLARHSHSDAVLYLTARLGDWTVSKAVHLAQLRQASIGEKALAALAVGDVFALLRSGRRSPLTPA